MLLKRLDFIGFKSFAQKTVLDFPGGITAIVGPNGSGKSNVIDGIRWILGEREAKNLRGGKAEDLIFAGTPKRPRMGMGQVTIVFDNTSGFFPVDFPEVEITRRIDRSGESEYFLNKESVRLKDIIDFFAKARLGTRGLSIINQGSSDLFVRATPQERREMVEEILGLRQYQLKKQEAERKLKNTTINLEKVRAMIDELTPHLRFLKRQTAKWERVSEVEKEVRDLEQIHFGYKLKDIEEGIRKFDPEIQRMEHSIREKQKELKELDGALKKIESSKPNQQQVSETRSRREQLFQERFQIEKEVSRLEAKVEFLNSMVATEKLDVRAGELLTVLEDVQESLQRLLGDKNIEQVHKEVAALLEKVQRVTHRSVKQKDEISELKTAKDALIKRLAPISEALKQLSENEAESTHSFEQFNEVFRSAFEKVEKKKDEIAELENMLNKVKFEVERFRYRKQDIETQLAQAGRALKEFEAHISQLPVIRPDLADIERKMLRARSELASIGEIDHALIQEAKDTETRHTFLSGQSQDLEKATKDLEQLIQDLDVKIHHDFTSSLHQINEEFHKFFELMFGGGKAKMKLEKPEPPVLPEEGSGLEVNPIQETSEAFDELSAGIELEVSLPRKKIKGLDMLSGGEKSLVSIAALFALIAVSPPPFLVLDEVDAALDERNTKRFADLIKNFSKKTQFILVTHNRSTMEAANVLYGVTMEEDGVSKILSIHLE